MEETTQDMFPYAKVMEVIKELQGDRAAIVILQDADGGTTYLRHAISKENAAEIMRIAYL